MKTLAINKVNTHLFSLDLSRNRFNKDPHLQRLDLSLVP